MPFVAAVGGWHQCLAVRDDSPLRTVNRIAIWMKEHKAIAKAGEQIFFHQEYGTFIGVQHVLCRAIGWAPKVACPNEPSVAIVREDRPSAHVERRFSMVVNFDPIFNRLNRIVVAVRKNLSDGEVH